MDWTIRSMLSQSAMKTTCPLDMNPPLEKSVSMTSASETSAVVLTRSVLMNAPSMSAVQEESPGAATIPQKRVTASRYARKTMLPVTAIADRLFDVNGLPVGSLDDDLARRPVIRFRTANVELCRNVLREAVR